MRLSKYKLASIALNPFIGPVNTENFISYIKNPYSRWEDEYGCIFVHVPKSAGKAVTLSLFGAPNGTGHNKITCYERYPEKFKNYRNRKLESWLPPNKAKTKRKKKNKKKKKKKKKKKGEGKWR